MDKMNDFKSRVKNGHLRLSHVHIFLTGISSVRPSKFGHITSEDERPPNYIEFSKGLHYRAAMADFWQTRPPQLQPHPMCATCCVLSCKIYRGLGGLTFRGGRAL